MPKKKTGLIIKCKCCEKEFYVPNYRIATAKFCSLECQNHKQYNRSKHICKLCNKEFEDSPSRKGKKVFCSQDCYSEYQTVYKTEKDRRSAKMFFTKNKERKKMGSFVRRLILTLKPKKCEICGFDEYESCLDIHHIDMNANNNTIENLAVLCVMCHRKIHRGIIAIALSKAGKSNKK